MTIQFQGAPGDLFNVLGKLGVLIKQVAAYQASQNINYTNATTQFDLQPDIQTQIGAAYLTDLSGPEVSCATAQNMAGLILNRLVYLDNPQPNQDLQTVNLPASITELIRQMIANSVTVLKMTLGLSIGPAFTNPAFPPGNPVIVTSLFRDYDGLLLENLFAELLQIACTQDSYTGGATAFNEQFSVTGENSVSDVFAWNWPAGSGCSISTNAIDGDTDFGSGNYLTNSGFDTFTVANTPDSWTILTGTPGTNIFQENSLIYSGTGALKILGDGSTLVSLSQPFTASFNTQYGCNLFMRCGGSAPLQGVLQIDLVDQNNNIINDNNGTPNSFSINLTGLGVSYASFNGAFRLPFNLPTTVSLRLNLTTALNNGAPIYIDKLSLGLMSQLYTSGPFISIHAGNIPSVLNDYNNATITNSRGAGGTLSTWQTLLNQLYGLQTSDILIPSSLSPNVNDSLIS